MHRYLILLSWFVAVPAMAYDFAALVDAHVAPVYQQLAEKTTSLDQAATDYCGAPSDQRLTRLRATHREGFLAWQGAQHLRLGPIKYLSREHRFALWPDKRGTVRKHLTRLREDPSLDASDFDISKKSVAVQGFSALERLLYETTPPGTTDCRILTAITANLSSMSQALYDDWFEGDEAYGRYLATPGPENPLFVEEAEVAGELLNSLYTELELIVTQKLGNPMGSGPERARGRRAEAWRAGLATPAIRANLEATQALYQTAFGPALQDNEQHRTLDGRIEAAFATALTTVAKSDDPLAQTIETADGYAWATQLKREVSSIKQLITRDLAQTLDLPLGFNSLDGD